MFLWQVVEDTPETGIQWRQAKNWVAECEVLGLGKAVRAVLVIGPKSGHHQLYVAMVSDGHRPSDCISSIRKASIQSMGPVSVQSHSRD